MSAQDGSTLSSIVKDGNLSLETFLEMLKDGHLLAKTIDVEEEMQRIHEARESALRSMQAAVSPYPGTIYEAEEGDTEGDTESEAK